MLQKAPHMGKLQNIHTRPNDSVGKGYTGMWFPINGKSILFPINGKWIPINGK